MPTLIAISGIDQEIIQLSWKKNPKLLLLPTASSNHPE